MKSKFRSLPVLLILFLLPAILAACALPGAVDMPVSPPVATQAPLSGVEPVAAPQVEPALRPLEVAAVQVEIGIGSPIPVEVVASGDWHEQCSQLARLETRFSEYRVEISLLASPTDPNCPPDYLGIPYRIAVPLNMAQLPLGLYTVIVNGVETSFDWTGTSPQAGPESADPLSGAAATIAYLGPDGNLWLLERSAAEPRQVTFDGTPLETNTFDTPAPTVSYYFPALSSDGRYLAIRREAGTPVASGMQFETGLWVYDLSSGESRLVYDRTPAGFAWQPGTHLLAYGQGAEEGYFGLRSTQPDAAFANGLWGLDLDSGELSELVEPERGYALYTPHWSPDGRYLGFDELVYYEGRGPTAYYDFTTRQYIALDDQLGTYDWLPDGSRLAYDRMTYTATGEERIFLRDRQAGGEQAFSLDLPGGYAYYPVFSPQGDALAYLAALGGPDDMYYNLYVQPLAGGEPRDLGRFESVWNLSWAPDGEHLIFSAGSFGAMQVLQVSLVYGTVTVLAEGNSPAVAGG